MVMLGCALYFEMEGVAVLADALGSSATFTRDGMVLRLDLPKEPDEFKFGRVEVHGQVDPRVYDPTVALIPRSDDLIEVRLVRVVVNVEADIDPDDADADNELLQRVIGVASTLTSDFSAWVWVHGQVWNQPTGEFPRLVSDAQLVDVERSVSLRTRLFQGLRIAILPKEPLLSASAFRALASKAESGPPSVAELLLAEAQHYLWNPAKPAPDRAILIAAIALETRVKKVLRECAPVDRRELVEALIGNPRDYSMALVELFHTVMHGAVGRSLNEESPDTFKQVRKLVEARNGIVHRGETKTAEEARGFVDAAVSAFGWLDAIPVSD
jgi:hypothetical protein